MTLGSLVLLFLFGLSILLGIICHFVFVALLLQRGDRPNRYVLATLLAAQIWYWRRSTERTPRLDFLAVSGPALMGLAAVLAAVVFRDA